METAFVLRLPDGRNFQVDRELRVGREPPCEIVAASPQIAPHHATLWVRDDSLFVRDEGSETGTLVNDARLPSGQPFQLRVGDSLRLGPLELAVAAATAHALTAPPPDLIQTALGMSPVGPAAPVAFALALPDGRRVRLGSRTRLGRDASCHIRLSDPLVSGHHALIWVDRGVLLVRDEGSTNGTFLNDTRLPSGEPAPLRPGDKLRLGRTELTVAAASGQEADLPAAPPPGAQVDLRQTVRLSPPTPPPPSAAPAAWRVRGPDGAEYAIEGEMLVGRESACQVKLIDPRASRRHAVLWVSYGALLVRDDGSRNGTFVNEARLAVGQSTALRSGDIVRFADSEFSVQQVEAPAGASSAPDAAKTDPHGVLPR